MKKLKEIMLMAPTCITYVSMLFNNNFMGTLYLAVDDHKLSQLQIWKKKILTNCCESVSNDFQ